VIHDAGGGHRLRLPFGDRRELRVGLDGRKAVLAAILRDHRRHVVFRVRQRGHEGHADGKPDHHAHRPLPYVFPGKTHRVPVRRI